MNCRPWLSYLAALTVAGCLTPGRSAAAAPPQDAPPPSADVERWVRQLDSNEFLRRKAATENLIKAGRPAIAPLAEVLRGSNLEVTTRAIHALRELAVQGDDDTELEARQALETIARTRPTAASRLASDAILALNERRQQRSVDRLRKLGAKIGFGQSRSAFAGQMAVLQAEIGTMWQGTAADLRQLRWIEELNKLVLTGPRIDDATVKAVAELPDLRYLTVRNAQVTDAAIRHLRNHRSLSELDLMYIPVTDRCMDDLKTLVNASRIRIFGTNVSPDAAEQLAGALANANIEHKRGAFLGVRCLQGPMPCEVSQVVGGSGADEAGLRMGDIIVGYAGKPIRSFDDLRELIGQYKVGDTVEIQVIRGGQPALGKFVRADGMPSGITAEQGVLGCEVTAVAPDSAASIAGLRKGDILVEFNDERITSVKQLEEAFEEAPNGQPSAFGFLRDASKLTMTARFGEWQDEE